MFSGFSVRKATYCSILHGLLNLSGYLKLQVLSRREMFREQSCGRLKLVSKGFLPQRDWRILEKDPPETWGNGCNLTCAALLEIGEMAQPPTFENIQVIAGHDNKRTMFVEPHGMRFWAPTHPSELDGTSQEYLGGKIQVAHGRAILYEVWGICLWPFIVLYKYVYLSYIIIHVYTYTCFQ